MIKALAITFPVLLAMTSAEAAIKKVYVSTWTLEVPNGVMQSQWIKPVISVFEHSTFFTNAGGKRVVESIEPRETLISVVFHTGVSKKTVRSLDVLGSMSAGDRIGYMISGGGKNILLYIIPDRQRAALRRGDPYELRVATQTILAYFDGQGNLKFRMEAPFKPINISSDGTKILVVNEGLNLSILNDNEKSWNYVLPKDATSWEPLKSDPRLIDYKFQVISDEGKLKSTYVQPCKGVLYFPSIKFSPSGEWFYFNGSAIYIQTGKSYPIPTGDLFSQYKISEDQIADGIEDDGTVVWQLDHESLTTRRELRWNPEHNETKAVIK